MSKYDWTGVKEYIEENIDTQSYIEMAELLGFSPQVLRDYARHAGFRKHKWIDWTDEIVSYLRNNYKDGAVPIAKKFNIPLSAIYKKAESMGLKVLPKDSYIDANGYRMLGKSHNRKAEHRVVMEDYLGRELKPSEIVHHIDGEKLNNDIDNLCLTNRSDHINEHREELVQGQIKKIKYSKQV